MLHILTYNSYRGQSLLRLNGRDFSHLYLLGKLLVQHVTGQVGVGIAHTDGGGILRRCLRHHEHADAILGQRLEYPVVHTNHANHTQTLYRNQTGVIDRRDTLDGLAVRIGYLLLDDGTCSLRVKRILYPDRDILVAHRVDGRRIHHLGSEVAQLGGLYIAQFIDCIGCRDDTRIGRHKSVHIRPYLQHLCIQRCRYHRCGIVRPSTSQVGDITAHLVRRDKTGHQSPSGSVGKGTSNQFVGQFGIQHMFGMLLLRLHEGTRIVPFGTGQFGCNDG